MFDYHIHTNMSVDSGMTPMQVANKAKELGLREICITNHQDWEDVINGKYRYASTDEDWKEFMLKLDDARKIYSNIKFGCELGFFSENKGQISAFAKKHAFDYIIGSVHILNGYEISNSKMIFPDTDIRDWYRQYFRLLKDAIEADYFDCVGHFDIVKKTAPPLGLEHYKREVADCISAMKKTGIGFELNCMGWHHKCKECYPSPGILKMLCDAGIDRVTIGSDSHSPDLVGYKIAQGLALLRDTGFGHVCTFTRRKSEYHKI